MTERIKYWLHLFFCCRYIGSLFYRRANGWHSDLILEEKKALQKGMKNMLCYKDIRRFVKHNNFFSKILKMLVKMERDDNQKAELITYLSIFNANNFTGNYSDEELESELNKIGQKIYYAEHKPLQKNSVLHVMTNAWNTGGHTGVVNNWIQFDKGRKYSVIFTEMPLKQVPAFLEESVRKSGGNMFCLRPADNIHMAKQLLDMSDGFERIVLHVDMYDVVPIIAYSNPKWKIPVYFYNHANFSFSLGISVADCIFNICTYDLLKTKRYRGGKDLAVLPVPSREIYNMPELVQNMTSEEIKRKLCSEWDIPQNSRIIISMGSDYKYKKVIGYDFGEFVKKLLEQMSEETYFIIIGANPEGSAWKKLSDDTSGHAKAMGILPREQVTLWMKIADAYVTSFPMLSAGYLEARKNNVPTFSLKVTNREREYLEDEWCLSPDEMIEKIKYTIGNIPVSGQSISEVDSLRQDPHMWCELLNKEWNNPRKHEIHKFVHRPALTKEEAINIQLRQGEKLFTYARWKRLSVKNRILLRGLEKIYLDKLISRERLQ